MKEYDVLILGAGPSGLAAAQELLEQGLSVLILEAAPFIGGKPISGFSKPYAPPKEDYSQKELEEYLLSLPHISEESSELPWEHAFRVYPENYYNLLSLFERIPLNEKKTIEEQLTNAIRLASYVSEPKTNQGFFAKISAKLEAMLFGLSLYTPYLVSEKRSYQFDDISIEDYFRLDHRSLELQDMILRLTDSLSSGMLSKASTLAVINILMNYFYAPNRTGFRTFNKPTVKAWLEPWESYLIKLGADIHINTKVVDFQFSGMKGDDFSNVKIDHIVAIENGEKQIFRAKRIISALPVDALLKIINHNLETLRYDPRLIDLYKITTLPATGVQLYYETPIKGIEKLLLAGTSVTHPWGVSYVDQTSYWENPTEYAQSNGVITIYTAITNQRGKTIPKTMQQCTANEIAYEMFIEVENELKKRNLSIPKRIGFSCHSYKQTLPNTDHFSQTHKHHLLGSMDEDQLHLCMVGMYQWRPLPETTYLNNLSLAGAYTQTKTYYVSTMEAAAESGRRAANTLLSYFNKSSIKIHKINPPFWIRSLRAFDRLLFLFKLPNPFNLLRLLLRKILNTRHIHMDHSVRKHENLHW